ncbi:MAG: HlyC/CorC family transporter [Desulfobacula sp.]|jgi:putative hemolysin|uniref:hemolysin family protein n=1 Tax=Desulfobacula sp. TaxID=2593537 RepID=UPI001DADE4DA|nr:HlyC/CorC family transporter [Desulfobacula sp.]MBT3484444.1 HlyC/CorC family transporter [Desulfobacula sp.]MBT3803359.1 HlyC/CorC family transporter [Desulfobacula sp.]MBT4023674.1 HlyC/CorC family transporter [Desulfobacula sp.]MBT4197916.1 HlyC/CorC family transporter [Desulfobacula sp.]
MTFELTILVIGLLLSGFFSSSETALFSISKVKALHIAKDGSKSGILILKMKEDSHTLLTTILIGNNLVNIGASAIATSIAISYFKSNAVGIATGIMTMLILVFGEIFPKSFANHNNIFVARIVIYPLFWLSRLFFPLIYMLNFIPKLHGTIDTTRETVTEDELMTMVEVVEEEGEIKEEEKEYITNIFEFDDTCCSEIMTPRADMFVIDVSEDMDIKKILKTGFSRIPVIEDSIDNIIGILHVKDLFASFQKACASESDIPLDVKQIMRKPYFIPESKKLDSLLQDFKQKKNHIAIVVDEHGGISGITTLEDVVEEIIGEIIDETDRMTPDIVRLKGNKWLVAGKIDIDDLNKELEIEIPESNTYDTFSGFFLEQIGRIPKSGESIIINMWTLTVKDMDGNRIQSFIIKKD